MILCRHGSVATLWGRAVGIDRTMAGQNHGVLKNGLSDGPVCAPASGERFERFRRVRGNLAGPSGLAVLKCH